MRISMGTLFRYIKADFHKTKHLPIRLAHLLIPVGTNVLFLIYYTYSAWDAETKVTAYFQVLGMGLPLLTGLFCAMLSEQEFLAGGFWNMLSARKRAAAFFSKLLVLLLLGMFALLLASVLFGTGYFLGMGQRSVGYLFYWKASFVLMGSSIFLYVLHLFLAFRFDKGVTIALGFVESLLSALLLTGMGEGIWMYVPAAWASRFVTLFYYHEKFCRMNGRYDTMDTGIFSDLRTAVWVCMALTFVSLLAFGIWACRFESPGGKE